ncbi:hypothetical protein PO124_16390 [Bacillus licheniformis]|nr:hypothetical protein [Bacillus licheniformis]
MSLALPWMYSKSSLRSIQTDRSSACSRDSSLGRLNKEAQLNVAAQVSEEVLQYAQGNPVMSAINLPAMTKDSFEKSSLIISLPIRSETLCLSA